MYGRRHRDVAAKGFLPVDPPETRSAADLVRVTASYPSLRARPAFCLWSAFDRLDSPMLDGSNRWKEYLRATPTLA